MYDFSNVTVGSNTITNATTFPSFFISSPEPPVFNRGNTDPYIYAPNNDAVMKVLIDNCEAATVYADILKDGSSETSSAAGALKDGNWVFEVPKDGSGKQDGIWSIKQLRLWNVYDENGNPYTEDAPLVFDLTDEPNVTIKVVSSVKVTVSPLADPDLGKDGETITAQFMDTQTVSGLYVTITDFEDEAIVNADGTLLVSDVKLIYDYGGETKAYGGYTSTGVSATEEMYTVSLTEDGTNAKFVQSGALTVQYAGTYTPKLQYTINGMTYTMPAEKMGNNAPGFAVWSKTPTAKITGHTPTGTYATKVTYTESGWIIKTPTFKAGTSMTSSHSDYAATLYAKAAADNSTRRHGTYTEPTLTITVSNVTGCDTATLTLPAGSNGASAISYEYTKDGVVTKTLGKAEITKTWSGGIHDLEAYYGHGTVTITTMTLVKDNVTYTVTLENPLVITNPSS